MNQDILRVFLAGSMSQVDYDQLKVRLGKDTDKYLRRVYSYKKNRYSYVLTLEGMLLLKD